MLSEIRQAVRHAVQRQIASLWIRFLSLLFLFLGGLCPFLPKDIPHAPVQDLRPWGHLLIGIGGGLLLFARPFGVSSSWMRFIWASFEIKALLGGFRMRWVKTLLEAKDTQSFDTFRALIVIVGDAIKGIHAIVLTQQALHA